MTAGQRTVIAAGGAGVAALLALALLTGVARNPCVGAQACSVPGRCWCPDDEAEVRIAPPDGRGLPSAVSPCDTLTPAEFEDGLCWSGDGTMRAGSIGALSAAGSQRAVTVCPSGPDCATATATVLGPGQLSQTASLPGPAGDFTACSLQAPNASVNYADAWIQGTNSIGPSNFNWQLGEAAVNPGQFSLSNGTTSTVLNTAAGSFAVGRWVLLCGTYQRVGGAANNLATLYHNGAVDATTNTAVLVASTSRSYQLGSTGSTLLLRSAFWVPRLLSPARIAQIARAVLADAPTSARGHPITNARTSSRGCVSSSGAGSIITAGRTCVTEWGVDVRGAGSNLVQWSQSFTQAPWYGATIDAGAIGPFALPGAALVLDGGLSQVPPVGTASNLTLACALQAGAGTDAVLTIDAGTVSRTCDAGVYVEHPSGWGAGSWQDRALPTDGGWLWATCTVPVSNPATAFVRCGPRAGGGSVYVGAMALWPQAFPGQYVRTEAAGVSYDSDKPLATVPPMVARSLGATVRMLQGTNSTSYNARPVAMTFIALWNFLGQLAAYQEVGVEVISSLSLPAPTTFREAVWREPMGMVGIRVNGVENLAPDTSPNVYTRTQLFIGHDNDTSHINAVVKDICASARSRACR